MNQSAKLIFMLLLGAILIGLYPVRSSSAEDPPHIILVMADDMGWGQTGYQNHPILKTPNLDAMAANGLRLDRFYAGGPVCSPTRASMLTGRSHERAGVLSHGYALRLQEKTLAQALQKAGYATGHFGKWHLNGHRGPGAPIFADDPHNPSVFGFDEWVSVSNFYDVNPVMSRSGKFEEFSGDSSDIVVNEATQFLKKHHPSGKPMFVVIWYGTPHSPFKALDQDKAEFKDLNAASANHYGELVAMDRSLGTLRKSLRDLDIADNTLLVFCSDNGGLPNIKPETVGGLRGNKGTVFEGGIRVPGVIEWPAVIKPRVTKYPACVMDLFPTMAEIVGLPEESMIKPLDGISLRVLFESELEKRSAPIGFRYQTKRAIVTDRYKLLTQNLASEKFELYDLIEDAKESRDLSEQQPEIYARLKQDLLQWNASVDASFAGTDYAIGKLSPPDPEPINWFDLPQYKPYLPQWKQRWEYQGYLNRADKSK
ncbi:MAG TPA: N-acetylgalactosamine 6-sulfate sulfatase [Planctomycetaceae bacterium]|nr:N-acetylgalactosamine 6-sulfate sulfatase [Planctomycetaceae bacterium]